MNAGTVLQGLMIVIGLAMIVRAAAAGAGPGAVGILVGACFVALGAGRLWLERRGR